MTYPGRKNRRKMFKIQINYQIEKHTAKSHLIERDRPVQFLCKSLNYNREKLFSSSNYRAPRNIQILNRPKFEISSFQKYS